MSKHTSNAPFKPMASATVTELSQVHYPVLGSPKIDGFRAVVRNGSLATRNLLPFPNQYTQKLFSHASINGFDGEIVAGEPTGMDVFSRTSKAVTAVDGTPDVTLYVFDYCADGPNLPVARPYRSMRYNRVCAMMINVRESLKAHIKIVPQVLLKSESELEKYIAARLKEGYEGVMLRTPEGEYKHGRSTLREQLLMKYKPYEDSEAVVLGAEEGVTNINETGNAGRRRSLKAGLIPNGTLGKLHVKDVKTGAEFMLGTGTMRHVEARALWEQRHTLPGRVAKYKYQRVGTVTLPRQPIFLGWRHPADMPS